MKPLAKFGWHVLVLGAFAVPALAEEEPLHTLVDRHLAPAQGVEVEPCSDAEFLRRASIDLTGMPPTADEARAFLAESAEDKRVRLIDRLFASPHFVRHFATVLDIMLMERRGNTHVSADEWQAWLIKSVWDNKPWNVMAREILAADGDDSAQRAPARFALDRGSEPNLLTRDIGRVFFGRDMQCAQCHDHPLVPEYLQSDYHGLLAFVAPTYALVRTENGQQKTLQAEKAGNDLSFESVFIKTPRRTGARFPDGVMLNEPFFLPGDEYQVAPADNVKPVPKFSRRAKLAELATNGTNSAFNENMANRLWAMMFGRGLVYPADMHHSDNPATHPELMRVLGERFAAMKFDMRAFLRELALTSAYQRSYDLPARLVAASQQAAHDLTELEKNHPLLEEASRASSDAYENATQAWQEAEAALLPVAGELDAARTKYAETKKKFDDAVKAVTDAKAQLQVKHAVAKPVQEAVAALEQAVKASPDDAPLTESTQKLSTRSQEITAELATLTKTFEDATAAIKPPTEELAAATPSVGEAFAKLAPLNAAFLKAEQDMALARTRASQDAEVLAASERRRDTLRQVAELAPLHKALVAATELKQSREAELAAAQARLDEQAAKLAQSEAAVKSVNDAAAQAVAAVEAARRDQSKRAKAAKVVAAAFVTVAAARPMPFDDTMLTSASDVQELAIAAPDSSPESQVEQTSAAASAAQETAAAAQKAYEAAVAEHGQSAAAVEAATAALEAARTDAQASQVTYDTTVVEVAEQWSQDFTIAALKPLSPEQLCWTVFRATGVYDRQWQAEAAELEKAQPLSEEQKNDAAQLAARQLEIEQRTFDKLKSNVATFVTYYGAAAGQPQGDFFATVDQALFAANGSSFTSWIAPAEGNVTDRMLKAADANAAAEELYLALLTRLPTKEEVDAVAQHLAPRTDDKPAAVQELVWALLNSAEFRFNH